MEVAKTTAWLKRVCKLESTYVDWEITYLGEEVLGKGGLLYIENLSQWTTSQVPSEKFRKSWDI